MTQNRKDTGFHALIFDSASFHVKVITAATKSDNIHFKYVNINIPNIRIIVERSLDEAVPL